MFGGFQLQKLYHASRNGFLNFWIDYSIKFIQGVEKVRKILCNLA